MRGMSVCMGRECDQAERVQEIIARLAQKKHCAESVEAALDVQ